MQAALLIEDRDLAFLFTDRNDAHPDARPVEIEIDPSVKNDIENENIALWLWLSDDKLRVVPLAGFDFSAMNDQTGYSIPTPLIVESLEAYEQWLEEA